jgi:hypothetical protein
VGSCGLDASGSVYGPMGSLNYKIMNVRVS